MTIIEIANWVYLNKYAPAAKNDWQTISQEEAMKKSNHFLLWVIEAQRKTMSNKNDLPKTDEEIEEWIEEREEESKDDFDKLIRDFEELELERSCFLQGARLP